MLTLINGDGAGVRPQQHLNGVLATATGLLRTGQLGTPVGAIWRAPNLPPSGRGVVPGRRPYRGIQVQTVLRVLS